MANWLELLEIKLPILTASLMGAIATLTFEDKIPFLRAMGMIACGAAASTYANPVIMQYFNLPLSYGNGVAFMVGLVAMKFAGVVLMAAGKLDADMLIKLIFRTGNGTKPTNNDKSDSDRTS